MAAIAVLVSGGLDSAILVADQAQQASAVHPIYVRSGLYWEAAEQAHLQRFLESVQFQRPALQKLAILELPVADLYGRHWGLTGEGVPSDDSADDAVYLPGRNLLLLLKAMLWCCLRQLDAVAIGVLHNNPFSDAKAEFFAALESAFAMGMGGAVRIERPYAGLSKRDVLLRGRGLPLQYTFSCIRPIGGRHCGHCNKCGERRKAFADAGIADLTEYARP